MLRSILYVTYCVCDAALISNIREGMFSKHLSNNKKDSVERKCKSFVVKGNGLL